VTDLQSFREAVIDLAMTGSPLDARDRVVVVPTHAAAAHLVRSIEDTALRPPRRAVVLPDLVTSRELTPRFGERLREPPRLLTDAEREGLLGIACRAARDRGDEPPFRLRPGLIAAILHFYDELRRRQNRVGDFERRVLDLLEPGAATDRGAERLVRQTRFLVAAFREFETRARDHGVDEHGLRERSTEEASPRPFRHAVLTVADEAFDPCGLHPAHWDFLTRVPGLQRLDVVVTDIMLAGALHERIHRMLPGIEEVRYQRREARALPVLLVPERGGLFHLARDREEEVAAVARRVKADVRRGTLSSPGRAALVVRQRLPYVYVAREILRSGGVPCQMFDALPLAGEPYAAALDLILTCVGSDFARVPAVALLRSPHFRFATARDASSLDRALAEAGYLGGIAALERLLDRWRAASGPESRRLRAKRFGEPRRSQAEAGAPRALRCGELLLEIARQLLPLRSAAPVADHLGVLLEFLSRHEASPVADKDLRARHLRARGAILATLGSLRDGYARTDSAPVHGDDVAALVRRWIEGQTFAPRSGDAGVHLVDSDSARFGRFEYVHIAGAVDGEWPDRPRRSIFYSPAVLRELGWPSELDRLAGARAAFAELLGLPTSRLSVSAFALEADALVSPSPLTDELEQAGLDTVEESASTDRVFEYEALCDEPGDPAPLGLESRDWVARRFRPIDLPPARFHGSTSPPPARPYSLSAFERYQDCPFKFFAADVLGLKEGPEDESTPSPRARGRLVHEVFERFFTAWDSRVGGAITTERLDQARALLEEVAEPLLARLTDADAALERTRLLGSAISTGSFDLVMSHEAARVADVAERWLEHRFDGEFGLGIENRRVALRGVADRVDLLRGNRLRVIDYKSGGAPNPARALQVPIYALCAQETLQARDGRPWAIDEAAYLAFGAKRSQVSVVAAGSDGREALEAARRRLLSILDGIARGQFPPRPHDRMICDYCAYPAVCRKDYVDD
jgi:RecB family exonuclease